jgi:hypothetical protein
MAFAILLGAETAFDGEPATLRLTLSGDMDLTADDKFALALALPMTILTSDEETNGFSFSQTAVEIPPSLRLRLLPEGVVRIYGDLGVGAVVVLTSTTADSDKVFDAEERAGFMTRAGIGLEIGPRGSGFTFVVEPLSTRTYYINSTYGALGVMIGAGARF